MSRRLPARRLLSVLAALGLLFGIGGLAGALGVVKLMAPRVGAKLKGTVLVQSVVSTSDVSYVVLGVDDRRIHSTNASPYSFMLDTTEFSDGAHTLFIEAYSRTGALARSPSVKVLVMNGNARPTPEVFPAPAAPQVAVPATVPTSTPPAVASRVPWQGSESRMPMAVSAELKGAPQAVSLPPVELPAPRTMAAEPQGTALTIAAVGPVPAAVAGTSVTMNGKAVELGSLLHEAEGTLDAGFRKVLTAADWDVTWDSTRHAGIARSRGHKIEAVPGRNYLVVDGQSVPLGGKISLVNNRLIVGLRPMCRAAGISVTWIASTHTAQLQSPSMQVSVRAALE